MAAKRYTALDLLRGAAIIVMIETHVSNELLNAALKTTAWFSVLNYINGLVAPSFLFVTGFAFIISTRHKVPELRKTGSYFWKKAGKTIMILLAGYALHMSFLSYDKLFHSGHINEMSEFLRVDVLQTIAIGLLLLLILRTVFENNRHLNIILIFLLVLITAISPYFWQTDLSGSMPVAIANYFNRLHDSYFPAFPWLNFILAGAVIAQFFSYKEALDKEESFYNIIAVSAVIMIAAGHIVLSRIIHFPLEGLRPHPLFFLQRLGYVLLLLYLFRWLNTRYGFNSAIINLFSAESLMIYFMHLQLLFRRIFNGNSMPDMWGGKLNVLESLAVYLAITVVMYFIALGWNKLKKKYPVELPRVTAGFVTILVIIFFLN